MISGGTHRVTPWDRFGAFAAVLSGRSTYRLMVVTVSTIQKVEVEGYRSFGPKQTVDLSQPGLVLLTGENRDRGKSSGAGKSTLFKAITTVLFEENDDGSIKKNGVNATQREKGCRIGLNFLSDQGTPYYAVYTYQHPTDGSDWYLWEWDGTDWRDKREEKKGHTKTVIRDILHMDYSQFINRAYVAQETVAEFIWRTQQERIEIFSGILGIGAIDRWVQSSRDWRRDTEKELAAGQGKKNLLDSQLSRLVLIPEDEIATLKQNLADINAQIADVEKSLKEKRASLKEISTLAELKANQMTYTLLVEELQEKLLKLNIGGIDTSVKGRYERLQKEVEDLRKEYRKYDVGLATAKARLKQIEALGLRCDACEQEIDGDTRRMLIDRYTLQVRGIEINETSYKRQLQHHEALHLTALNDYNRYGHALDEQKRLTVELQKQQGVLDSYNRQVADIRSVLADATDYPEQLNEEIEDLSREQIDAERRRASFQAALRAAEDAITQRVKLLTEQIAQEEENNTLEERMVYLKKVEALLGDKGFRAYKIKSSRVAFNNSLNRYLSVLTDGEIEAELVTEVLKADGKSMKSELDILVNDGEKRGVPIRQYSGGEKATLSLAIVGSFWDLASAQAGGSVNILLLDEPFANMDPWQVEKTCKLLESMRESGRTILVVTNQDSVRDRGLFDREIRAVKQNHITTIQEYDLSSDH